MLKSLTNSKTILSLSTKSKHDFLLSMTSPLYTDAETFAKRLKQARIAAGLSMEALCARMEGSVSKQAISKFESGAISPSEATKDALAVALGRDREYFTRPFTFDIDGMEISFRKKASLRKKDEAAIKIRIQGEIERYLEIEEVLGMSKAPSFTPPCRSVSSKEDARECARSLRAQWGLGTAAISNVSKVLEDNGVKVIRTDAPSGFDGLSGVVNGKHYIIVLNKNMTHCERNRFTQLHELGHLLINGIMAPGTKPSEGEKLCHAFASEMLLPSEKLPVSTPSNVRMLPLQLLPLQQEFGISIDAIVSEMKDQGIISYEKSTAYWKAKSRTEFKQFTEESRFSEVHIDRYQALVYAALTLRLITQSKAESLLGGDSMLQI